MATTQKKSRHLTQTLVKFYQKPVAKVSLELFLSIFAILFFTIFAIRPTLIRMSALLKEIESKSELNDQLKQKITALTTAQAEYLRLEPQMHLIDESLPEGFNLLYTIKLIEKVASNQEVAIMGFSIPRIPTEKILRSGLSSEVAYLELDIRLDGNYEAVRKFTDELLQLRRSFILQSVSFTVSSDYQDKELQTVVSMQIPYIN